MFATIAPTLLVAVLGLVPRACCCGGYVQPAPGPPGSISGQILFPARVYPSPMAVYAVEGFAYVMTRVVPPTRSYHLDVPTGNYQVVARLDANPLSSAGHLTCVSSSCVPVMTRAGYVTCRTADCQPLLDNVRVDAGRSITNIDVGGWGSLRALDVLWSLDEFGKPGPWNWQVNSPTSSPNPSPLPWRELPPASSEVLSGTYGVPDASVAQVMTGRLHLPRGWGRVTNPAEAVESNFYGDYANQPVRSPLALAPGGVWLTVGAGYYCSAGPTFDETATAELISPQGAALFHFEDPHSPIGRQPFSGYAFWGVKRLVQDVCMIFRFTTLSDESRHANLPTFIAIVQQAELVKPAS